MPQFTLAWLLIGVTAVATALGAWLAEGLDGLVVWMCIVMTTMTLAAPGPESWRVRWCIVLMGAGGGVLAFVILGAAFGDITVGRSWYRASVPVAGGWSAGLLIAAWQAAQVMRSHRQN